MPTGNSVPSLLLLDTHIWVWLINGDKKLKASKCLPLIEDAGRRDSVRVSIMSVWEIGMLVAKKRLDLRADVCEWTSKALAAPGISLMDLTPEIALESTRLPEFSDGDPIDRLLAASARKHNAVIVTRDRRILNYAKTKHLKAVKA